MTRNYWNVDTDLPSECPKGLAKIKKASKDVPIIIDFGSWQCRAGFANENMPSLVFDQLVHRVSERDEGTVSFAVGRSIPLGASKSSSRTAYDAGLIVHFTTVERTLDHIFDSLKLNDNLSNHPVILTQVLDNPEYIHNEMMELLFEGYQISKLALCNDILPALRFSKIDNAVAVSFGHNFTTICLIVDGEITKHKRINFGGLQASETLLKMIQCKYPTFPIKMTLSQAMFLLFRAGLVADDYMSVLTEMETAEGIERHNYVVQFPYPTVDKALEEERKEQAEALQAKRKEMAERLKERAAVKRSEKLKSKEDRLQALVDLKATISDNQVSRKQNHELSLEDEAGYLGDSDDMLDDDHLEDLRIHGFESMEELLDAMKDAEKDLTSFQNKLAGIVEEKEELVFDLVDIPDSELAEEQIKEKRKQRLLKASSEAREKSRLEKEEQARLDAEQAKRDGEWRQNDFAAWRHHYYDERSQVVARIKSRQKQREALSDRRSHASSVRLKNVMSLVDDNESENDLQQRKKKRVKAGKSKPSEELDGGNDDFGAKDSDWMIYHQLRRDELSDEEEDEHDQERLGLIESKLEEHDPEFFSVLAEEMSMKATIVDLLRNGGKPKVPEDQTDAAPFQLHINAERYRVPEIFFQPHIAGVDQAGIVEIIADLLKDAEPETAQVLLNNVFLCGGMCQIPGLEQRILSELTSCFPVGTHISISKQDSALDCWKGLALDHESLSWITRKEYASKNK